MASRIEFNQQEIIRIKADLEFYRQLMRELAVNPKRLATGTGGINQNTAEFHSLPELHAIIKDLEAQLEALLPSASHNVALKRARGDIL